MFATLVSDSLKHNKTAEGFLSKVTRDIKAMASSVIQKKKSSVLIDCLSSGYLQSYTDLFFMDMNTEPTSSELEALSAILCEAEQAALSLRGVDAVLKYEQVLSELPGPKFGPCTLYFANRCLQTATSFDLPEHIDLAQLNIGRYHEHHFDYDISLTWLSQCMRFPEGADAYILVSWKRANSNPAEAVTYFRQALECAVKFNSPRTGDARNSLGSALAAAGLFPEAIEQFTLELESSPDRARSSLASAYEASGDSESAIAQLETLLDSPGAPNRARRQLGMIYLDKFIQTGDTDLSERIIRLFSEYLETEKASGVRQRIEEAEIFLGVARAHVRFPEYVEASKDVKKMLRWKSSRSLDFN